MTSSDDSGGPIADEAVAVVGLSCRFPGARNAQEFWDNLRDGKESITRFPHPAATSQEATDRPGRGSHIVNARGVLDDIEMFDAGFFGYSQGEAQIMDPQHRIFLECAWEALEDAACDPKRFDGWIGVFAGTSLSTYLLSNLIGHGELLDALGQQQLYLANDKDFLAPRASYKMDLRGPSVVVQTACSSALVAVHLGCQSLISYGSDLVLAGAASIHVPQHVGYTYHEGGILSPDGHCRAFDADARGTVPGNGVGVVVLKRLSDALNDGDDIYAVIKGSALNNDGAARAGFTAPGPDGQAEVIRLAHEVARIEPETLQYIEAHGTGTPIGDPIELEALAQAFPAARSDPPYCALGSVKTNIGHLDVASGIAGLIKTILAIRNKQLPPSLHYQRPSPAVDTNDLPFYVNTVLTEWPAGTPARRAGVSSFGFGGTNAHVVLEEAPELRTRQSARPWHLLSVSAKSPTALQASAQQLAVYLDQPSSVELADVAYTLHVGRQEFRHRLAIVADTVSSAAEAFRRANRSGDSTSSVVVADDHHPEIAFMFPGQGAQHPGMGAELYEAEPVYRASVDACSEVLTPLIGIDLRAILHPQPLALERAGQFLDQTQYAQPALFTVEYALAQLWMSWGIKPQLLIGHSLGEYVAACLSGVFSLEDGLRLVAKRGELLQAIPSGAMLAVQLTEADARLYADGEVEIAAVNAPTDVVLSGPPGAIDLVEARLAAAGVPSRRLATSRAFHSSMVQPIVASFEQVVRQVPLRVPSIPFLSNRTGTWITDGEATDAAYWSHHLRDQVQFWPALKVLLTGAKRALLELGPGNTLTALARRAAGAASSSAVLIATLPHRQTRVPESAHVTGALARLWLEGGQIDWRGYHQDERPRRVHLPTYPFERSRYWIESAPFGDHHEGASTSADMSQLSSCLYIPSWRRTHHSPVWVATDTQSASQQEWLVFGASDALTTAVVHEIESRGGSATTVLPGEAFRVLDDKQYALDPDSADQFRALFGHLLAGERMPSRVLYLWSGTRELAIAPEKDAISEWASTTFERLLHVSQGICSNINSQRVRLVVTTAETLQVTGDELLYPSAASALGLCRVLPQEHPNVTCTHVDLILRDTTSKALAEIAAQLLAEFDEPVEAVSIAYRGRFRWTQAFEAENGTGEVSSRGAGVRGDATYLITGGMGNLGFQIAEHFARSAQPTLVLTGRTAMPEESEWSRWVQEHGTSDVVSRTILRLRSLSALGAHVVPLQADASDRDQMEWVLRQIQNQYEPLRGIVHAAGSTAPEAFTPIQDMARKDWLHHFNAKIRGALVVAELTYNLELDFVLLMSSIATVLGGLGMAAYSAANSFLDALAAQQSVTSKSRWISADWDRWLSADRPSVTTRVGRAVIDGLAPADAIKALDSLLISSGSAQFVVTRRDLSTSLTRWASSLSSAFDSRATASSSTTVATTITDSLTNEVEQVVTACWREVLGVETIHRDENFFDLGGDSLIATRILARLRAAFDLPLSIRSLFDDPTIAGIAAAIERALLDDLDALSDEEAERLAAETSDA